MRAISVIQPWASLLISGAKLYETRSWNTSHRGPLLIHASKRMPESARQLCMVEPFVSHLKAAGYTTPYDLPRQKVIGMVDLVDVHEIDNAFAVTITGWELQFGDYRPGRFAWEMKDPRPIAHFPFRGRLGIYDVPDALIQLLTPKAA